MSTPFYRLTQFAFFDHCIKRSLNGRNSRFQTAVQLRDDAEEYKTKADAVSQAEIYRQSYAITICRGENVQSPTVIGAQAANELLNIKGVKAS